MQNVKTRQRWNGLGLLGYRQAKHMIIRR